MAAAKRLGKVMELPNSIASLPSVILRVAETDPLLSAEAQPVLRRMFVFENMSNNGGTEKVEVSLPIAARMMLDEMAEVNIRAWKSFRNDPVRFFSAALLDLYGCYYEEVMGGPFDAGPGGLALLELRSEHRSGERMVIVHIA
jgi:hypothetical protein